MSVSETGEAFGALGFPQVSAAVGTAGGQADHSVLNSPSHLAQGHESCQRKVRTSLEALLLFWGYSASTRPPPSASHPVSLWTGESRCWPPGASAGQLCSSGKVYRERAACSFPGKSKSLLAVSLLGLKEQSQTVSRACPPHPAGPAQIHSSRLQTGGSRRHMLNSVEAAPRRRIAGPS